LEEYVEPAGIHCDIRGGDVDFAKIIETIEEVKKDSWDEVMKILSNPD
jgi:hypothetical protein